MKPSNIVRVLAWPDANSAGNNPYVGLMYRAFRHGLAEIRPYTPLMLRVPKTDVFHIQWPEGIFAGRFGRSHLIRKLKAWRILRAVKSVRNSGGILALTIHNLAPHRMLSDREAFTYDRFYGKLLKVADLVISLSQDGQEQYLKRHNYMLEAATEVIPHPHYRESYSCYGDKSISREALSLPAGFIVGIIGSIRRSKQIPAAIDAFRRVSSGDEYLFVSGGCDEDLLWDEIITARDGSSRIILRRETLSDELLAQSFIAIDVCLINQYSTLNSGTALLALSFNRPLIAPAAGSLPELQKVVGQEWMQLLQSPIIPNDLRSSIDSLRDRSRGRTAPLDIYAPETLSQRLFDVFSYHLRRRRNKGRRESLR